MMWFLLSILALALHLTSPVLQSERYHAFADQRVCCAVPNAFDVGSNAAFLLVGVFRALYAMTLADQLFSAGVMLTAIGSAYYHWRPTTERLVWDRLPMSMAFGAAFHEALNTHPSVAAMTGVCAVLWWNATKDLRPYIVFQYGGLLCVAWHGGHTGSLVLYGTAKACEALDRRIFEWTSHRVSGHTLKHLLAAAACAVL